MQLIIDTIEQGRIKLQLLEGAMVVGKSEKHTQKISESLLSEIEKLIKKQKIQLADLKKILVNPGPGGFSATRTGVATANALGYALDIPVGIWPGGKIKKIILPVYDKEPNITKAKLLPPTRGRQRGGGRGTKITKTSPNPRPTSLGRSPGGRASSQPSRKATAGTARGEE